MRWNVARAMEETTIVVIWITLYRVWLRLRGRQAIPRDTGFVGWVGSHTSRQWAWFNQRLFNSNNSVASESWHTYGIYWTPF